MTRELVRRFNIVADIHRNLFAGASVRRTIKVASVLYVLAKVGAFFSVWRIATLTYIGAFTLPVTYVKNKQHIDLQGTTSTPQDGALNAL